MSIPHLRVRRDARDETPYPGDNPGLVYQKLAPIPEGGREKYDKVIQRLAKSRYSTAYASAFRAWVAATPPAGGQAASSRPCRSAVHRRVRWFATDSAVLCGLGEQFPGENGLSLLPPWGFPYLPGASLKGVARAWATAQLGNGLPGDLQALFGTGGADGEAGVVDFLDAWIAPLQDVPPFLAEVLTPHHQGYYTDKEHQTAPTGFDGPVPVRFLAAQGVFRVVLEGPSEAWLDLAMEVLTRALAEHGIGAKTRTGYGRLTPVTGDLETKVKGLQSEERRSAAQLEADRQAWIEGLRPPPPPAAPAETWWKRVQEEAEDALHWLGALLAWDHEDLLDPALRRRIQESLEGAGTTVREVLEAPQLQAALDKLRQAIDRWERSYFQARSSDLLQRWGGAQGGAGGGRKAGKGKKNKKGGKANKKHKARGAGWPGFYPRLRRLLADDPRWAPSFGGKAADEDRYLGDGAARHAHKNLLLAAYRPEFVRRVLAKARQVAGEDDEQHARLDEVAEVYGQFDLVRREDGSPKG